MSTSIHVVRTEDMERVSGLVVAAGAPVVVDYADKYRGNELVALCGFVVMPKRGAPRAEAASVRALRADPPRFEREPMCLECMKHAAERR